MTVQAARIIRSVTALYALFLVAIVYTANAGIEHPGSVFVRNLPWGDKMGHIVLFGALTFVVNLALRCRTIRLGRFAVPIGTLLVSAVVVIEELSQGFLTNRTLDVADLAADAVGIVLATIAAVALWGVIQRRRSATEPATSTTVGDVNPTDHAGADIAESVSGESVVHMAEFVEPVASDEGSHSQDAILDLAFPGHSEPEDEFEPVRDPEPESAPVLESVFELEPEPEFDPQPEPESVPVLESVFEPEPEPEVDPEPVGEFDVEPEPEFGFEPEPITEEDAETAHEAELESVFYLDGEVEIDEPDAEFNEVDSIAETSDAPRSEAEIDSDLKPENESDAESEPAEAAEVDVVIDMAEIESAADLMLPTMADLDEVSADLDRVDAALVALDQQR